MSSEAWISKSIKVADGVFVEVRANAHGIVLGQGNDVWFHDLHITPEQAMALADALTEGAAKCLAARGDA